MMYSIQFKLNDQTKNMARLERLQRSVEKATSREILEALCSVAEGQLKELTPKGKTSRMSRGWEHSIRKIGAVAVGEVSNKEAGDEKGALILATLESGASYKQDKIFPRVSSVLAFFWERYYARIFARWVTAVDRKGFHMVRETQRFMARVYKSIAEVILAKRVKESIS
jgi:hypothetical protein